MCPAGFQSNEERSGCVECEFGKYSDPAGGLLYSTCESIENFDLCKICERTVVRRMLLERE
jgi:hypothetical protein